MAVIENARRVAVMVVTLCVVLTLAVAVLVNATPATAVASSISSSGATVQIQSSSSAVLRMDTSIENLIGALVDSGTEGPGTTDSSRRNPVPKGRAVA